MLKALMLRRSIDAKKAELEQLNRAAEAFATREAELEQAINEASTPDEEAAVSEAVDKFDADKSDNKQAREALENEIKELEEQITEIERKAPEVTTRTEKRNERKREMNINIRELPRNQRAFDALPMETRQEIIAREDVKKFLAELRNAGTMQRGVTGADLTIPVVFLDIIEENVYRYSKLLNRVRVRTVRGQARQTIGGTVPPAVWTECCAAFNELQFVFNQISMDCYKVAGFVMVCNSLLNDSDIALASEILEMISESLGLAKDMAILYGKGAAYKMPMGIVTSLALQSQPDNWPANGPAFEDLHSTHLITINGGSLSGAEFWAALRVATGKTFTKYSRGQQFWAMNSKTYALLESKAIATNVTGEWVAIIGGRLPIISGDIDVLEFIPDGDIIGGYGDLYLWAQRDGKELGTDMNGLQLRVLDNTLFYGKERADGAPVIRGAFVGININNSSVTTAITFPGDKANDATLEGLTVGALSLSPSFDAATQTYTASAANNVSSAAVTATPAQADAAIEITVTSGSTTKKVVNGGNAALAVGDNVIKVTVKKGNATRAYQVTVTRAGT